MINVPMPMSELCDRLTIASLKKRRLTSSQANHADLKNQISYYLLGIDIKDKKMIDFITELEVVNGEIWDAEHDIRRCLDDSMPLEQIGEAAIRIRDINMRRIAIKNRIAVYCGQAQFTDVKMNYARDGKVSSV